MGFLPNSLDEASKTLAPKADEDPNGEGRGGAGLSSG